MHESCTSLKAALDELRPLPPALVTNLEDWFRVELTWSSNAIEGNTLTRRETALVVEKGLTVRGKSLVEHLEAHNHARALDALQGLLDGPLLTEQDILQLHGLVLQGIDDPHAGCYRSVPVRISGSDVMMPNHVKVPKLMADFAGQLSQRAEELHPVALATWAHYELVSIHPFVDGNGRTARLLMNLLLIRGGYPPAIIGPRERERYIAGLEQAQLGGSREAFDRLIARAVERSLDIWLKAARGEDAPAPAPTAGLLRIGELAKLSGQTVPTIRHWTKQGLLQISNHTDSGYALYARDQVDQVARINSLKDEGFTLAGIRGRLKQQL